MIVNNEIIIAISLFRLFCFVLALNSTVNNSPLHTLITSPYDEEKELEKEIEYLEKRLLSAKSYLIMNNHQKLNNPNLRMIS